LTHAAGSGRGIIARANHVGVLTDISYYHMQGGIQPLFTLTGDITTFSSAYTKTRFKNISLDTIAEPCFVILPSVGTVNGPVSFDYCTPSSGVSIITGEPINGHVLGLDTYDTRTGINVNASADGYNNMIDGKFGSVVSAAGVAVHAMSSELEINPMYSAYVTQNPLPAPTAVLQSGGTIPNGAAVYYQIAPVWASNSSGALSYASNTVTTTSTNKQVQLSWTPTTGCLGYNIYRNGLSLVGYNPTVVGCDANAYLDNNQYAYGVPPGRGFGGPAMMDSSGLSGNLRSFNIGMGGTKFDNLGTATSGTIKYCSDCIVGNPCTKTGTGAFAFARAGVWVCQ
jgi:hypothetical protein